MWGRRSLVDPIGLAILELALSLLGTLPAESAEHTFPFPNKSVLVLDVPALWKIQNKALLSPPNQTLKFVPQTAAVFELLVTAVWVPSRLTPSEEAAQMKTSVQKAAEEPLKQAVERTAPIQELGGANLGYFFSVTDRSPAPGEFKYLTQGSVRVGDLMLAVTFLHRDPKSPDREAALTMLRGAKYLKQGG